MIQLRDSTIRKAYRNRRKAHVKRLHRREYKRLRELVPAVAQKREVSKVTVIEEAIKYIDELHQALVERLQVSSGCDREDVTSNPSQTEINHAVLHQMILGNLMPLSTVKANRDIEKHKQIATFLKDDRRIRDITNKFK